MIKSRLKFFLKILKWCNIVFFGFLTLYLGFAWLSAYLSVNQDWQPEPNGIPIYIISNGVHTDLALPYDSIEPIPQYLKKFQPYEAPKYVAYGWGDKGFYLDTPTWDDLTFKTAFRAAFGLSSAAMHVTFYDKNPTPNDKVKLLKVSKNSYEKLKKYIEASFLLNKNGRPNYISCCWYYNNKKDMFLDAHGQYTLFKTCNVWTNEGLKVAGIKAALWTPFEFGVLKQHKKR